MMRELKVDLTASIPRESPAAAQIPMMRELKDAETAFETKDNSSLQPKSL